MDKETLEKKRRDVEERFDVASKQKAESDQRSRELDVELTRLQGEHRALTSLIEEHKEAEDAVK